MTWTFFYEEDSIKKFEKSLDKDFFLRYIVYALYIQL
jgi:hypothetical protein